MNNKPFAIIRTAKIRTLRQLRAAAEHNARTAERGTEHADPTKPPELVAGGADAVATWHSTMAAKGLDPDTSPRKGAVVGIEWLATASPEFWATASAETRRAWQADTLAFVADQMAGPARPGESPESRRERGRGLILAAHYHTDETTPHLHVLTIPLTEKGRGAKGRPRKRDAGKPRTPSQPSWGLAAKDIIGGSKDRLTALQDDYAAAMAPHGLRRGIPRKETGERNRAPAHWRAEQARLADEARGDRADAALFRKAAIHTAKEALKDAEDIKRQFIKAAQETAADMLAKAADKAAEVTCWAKGLADTVRNDAKALGRAISFPAYANDPNAAEAREAIKAALIRSNKPPSNVKTPPETARKRNRDQGRDY